MDSYRLVACVLTCSCRRAYARTLAIPIDRTGRAARFAKNFEFTCIACTAGKFTPLQHIKPTDERAELVKKHALALNEDGAASLEQISWDMHVEEEDVRKILKHAGIEFSEGDA